MEAGRGGSAGDGVPDPGDSGTVALSGGVGDGDGRGGGRPAVYAADAAASLGTSSSLNRMKSATSLSYQ